ncbi:DUF4177 domain-containing protein [Paenibacillus psychroresistens]|uniref:DUF4177 domain-containing protein n=1 Tax=Paenibacillus psychroresistens TaxID=1778678 RepID=A0A6B8RC23_9BACL|nr:DUF4177 domain-containing protein [Paenibacillus psychroresistens]QGQ93889.1 DUF4177 domain-containing protein [Paenibacillus psychroresistens]
MQRFEYKTVIFSHKGLIKTKFDMDDELNKLGNEGWELVAMVTPVSGMGSSLELFATFKRILL